MAKSRIQTRVDDTRKSEVEQFADEHDTTQAEAVRRLVGRGIDYEQGELNDSEVVDRVNEVEEAIEDLRGEIATNARREAFSDIGFTVGAALVVFQFVFGLPSAAVLAVGALALALMTYPSARAWRSRDPSTRTTGRGESE